MALVSVANSLTHVDGLRDRIPFVLDLRLRRAKPRPPHTVSDLGGWLRGSKAQSSTCVIGGPKDVHRSGALAARGPLVIEMNDGGIAPN